MSEMTIIGYEDCPSCNGRGYHIDDRDSTEDCVRCWASGRIEVYGYPTPGHVTTEVRLCPKHNEQLVGPSNICLSCEDIRHVAR